MLRIDVSITATPDTDADERHAIAGPPEWVGERLTEYAAAGCDGFVVDLGHATPGLDERVHRFAEEVAPLVAARDAR